MNVKTNFIIINDNEDNVFIKIYLKTQTTLYILYLIIVYTIYNRETAKDNAYMN